MTEAEHRDPSHARDSGRNKSSTGKWQRLLLPLMVGTIVVGGAFFLIASALDIAFINRHVARHESIDLQPALAGLDRLSKGDDEGALGAARLRMLATLEASAIDRRYHQANALLLFSVLTRYLGFMTGMILSLVGAGFILGKISEASTTLDAETLAGKWGIKSTSPGLLLATLGAILMITAMQVQFDIKVSDVPVFLSEPASAGMRPLAPADSVKVLQGEQQLIDRIRTKLSPGNPKP